MAVCARYARKRGIGGADQDYVVTVRKGVTQDGFGQARQEPSLLMQLYPMLLQESEALLQ